MPGDLNEQAAADLFAYFYSARFFEMPGDAARGKRAFSVARLLELPRPEGGLAAKGEAGEPMGIAGGSGRADRGDVESRADHAGRDAA